MIITSKKSTGVGGTRGDWFCSCTCNVHGHNNVVLTNFCNMSNCFYSIHTQTQIPLYLKGKSTRPP